MAVARSLSRTAFVVAALLVSPANGILEADVLGPLDGGTACSRPTAFLDMSQWSSPGVSPVPATSACVVGCPGPPDGVCCTTGNSCGGWQPDYSNCGCNSGNVYTANCAWSTSGSCGQGPNNCGPPCTCPPPPGGCCVVTCTYWIDYTRPCFARTPEPPTVQPSSCDAPGPANASSPPATRPCPNCPPVAAGEPVSVTTGHVFFTHTDAVVGDLKVTRTFNSNRLGWGRFGIFGPGWNSNLDVRLAFPPPPAGSPGTTVLARATTGEPQYYYDGNQDGVFESVFPVSTESWVEGTAGVGYRRKFRRGGEEIYDAAGRLTSVVEWSGLVTTYGRDAQGRLSSVSRLGRSITFAYAGAQTMPSQSFGPGNTLLAKYTYTAGRLSKVEYPQGAQWSGYQYTYDSQGRIATVTDLEGKKLEAHIYDWATGRALTSERGDGVELLNFVYEPQRTVVTDARNNVTIYEHEDFRGIRRVKKVIGPCSSCGGGGDVQEWTYNAAGHITEYKDGEGNVTKYTYDEATGDLLTETRRTVPSDPSTELLTRFTYHPDGRMSTRTDPRQGLTSWTYDSGGTEEVETVRQVMSTTQTRQTVTWWNAISRPRLIQDPLGQTTEFFYTPYGDLDYVKDAAGKETHFTNDLLGRRTQVINPPTTPAALEPIYEYNVRGQVQRILDPTDPSKYTLITYDRGGRRIEVRDAQQKRTEYVYDLYGRLTWVKRWLGNGTSQNTQYHYDIMSNLEWIEDALGRRTNFEYDGHGRLASILYPANPNEERRSDSFTYDAAGRLRTRTDRRSVTTTYSYDGLGRLTGKSYSGTPLPVPPVEYGYDGSGNLTLAANTAATISWTYNFTGEPLTNQQTFPSQLSALTEYGYDNAGNRLAVTHGAFSLSHDYDPLGRLWHLYRGSDTFTFQYDDASRRRSLAYPNGAVTSLTPDTLSRLDILETARGTQPIARFDYAYDDVGNRVAKTMPGVNETYTYDDLYQLDTVQRNATPFEDYNHDPVGNRNGTFALPNPTQWAYSVRNEMLLMGASGSSYDRNGNLISRTDAAGAWTYEWDEENRLTRVTRDGLEVAAFKYDALGRRVEKSAGGTRTLYWYDGEDILATSDAQGGSRRYHVHGPGIDEPLARYDESLAPLTYYHADGLGSIVSHTDTSGAETFSRSYDAFGNLETGASEPGYAFTGREWDPETGLYYYRARYYDPKIGRFISEDPIRWAGGFNLYAYVSNAPTNWIDSQGHAKGVPGSKDVEEMASMVILLLLTPEAKAGEYGFMVCRRTGGQLVYGPGGFNADHTVSVPPCPPNTVPVAICHTHPTVWGGGYPGFNPLGDQPHASSNYRFGISSFIGAIDPNGDPAMWQYDPAAPEGRKCPCTK